MSTQLKPIAEQNFDRLAIARGEVVVYRRGEDEVEVTAIGSPRSRNAEQANAPVVDLMGVWDWLVKGASLILNDEVVQPQDGDLIIRDNGAIYEVTAPTGAGCYYPQDADKTVLRVHTKETGMES